jgi:hypothetical protein
MKKDVKRTCWYQISRYKHEKKEKKIKQLVIKNWSKGNNRKNEHIKKKSDHKIVKKEQKTKQKNTRSQNYKKAKKKKKKI